MRIAETVSVRRARASSTCTSGGAAVPLPSAAGEKLPLAAVAGLPGVAASTGGASRAVS